MNMPILRSEKGVNLITMLSVGVVALFWMMGTAALIAPAMQRTTSDRTRDELRNVAESALDYVVDQFSSASTRSAVDTTAGTVKTVTIPSGVLPNISGMSATVTVQNGLAPNYTYLYTPAYDPSQNPYLTGDSGYRMITATATVGNISRSLQVILMPYYNADTTSSSTSVSSTTTTTSVVTTTGYVPYFNWAFASSSTMTFNQAVTTNSYNSKSTTNPSGANFDGKYGGIASNAGLIFNQAATINGPLGAFPTDTNGSTSNKILTVNQPMTLNGNAVLNGGDTLNQTVTLQSGDTISTGKDNAPVYIPASQSPPATITNVASAYPSFNSGQLSSNSAVAVTLPGPAIYPSVSENQAATINITSGGAYSFPAVTFNQAATINVSTTAPVQFFLTGSGGFTANQAISINNNSKVPENFQLWNDGTGNITLNQQGNLYMSIYSPNSTVTFNQAVTMYGAIVSKSVVFNQAATLYFDEALASAINTSSTTTATTITSTVITDWSTRTTTTTQDNFAYFHVVSWREL